MNALERTDDTQQKTVAALARMQEWRERVFPVTTEEGQAAVEALYEQHLLDDRRIVDAIKQNDNRAAGYVEDPNDMDILQQMQRIDTHTFGYHRQRNDPKSALCGFMILQVPAATLSLDGETFVRQEFGVTTDTVGKNAVTSNITHALRTGNVVVLSELCTGGNPIACYALLTKLVEKYPDSFVLAKIRRTLSTAEQANFQGNKPALQLAEAIHLTRFTETRGTRRVHLPFETAQKLSPALCDGLNPSSKISVSIEVGFDVLFGYAQDIQRTLHAVAKREKAPAPTSYSRIILAMSASVLALTAWVLTFQKNENPAPSTNEKQHPASPEHAPMLTVRDVLTFALPDRKMHEWNMEDFSQRKTDEDQKIYLRDAYVTVTDDADSQKKIVAFAGENGSPCFMTMNDGCAFMQFSDKQNNGHYSIISIDNTKLSMQTFALDQKYEFEDQNGTWKRKGSEKFYNAVQSHPALEMLLQQKSVPARHTEEAQQAFERHFPHFRRREPLHAMSTFQMALIQREIAAHKTQILSNE